MTSLSDHSKTHGKNDTSSLPCFHCGMRFNDVTLLTAHVNQQQRDRISWTTDETPAAVGVYDCILCSESCKDADELKCHVERSHSAPDLPTPEHACVQCDLQFDSSVALKEHIVTHMDNVKFPANQDPCVQFKCPNCPEKFSEYDQVQEHIGRCSGVVDSYFECPLCKLCFFSQAELVHHSKTHDVSTNMTNNMFKPDPQRFERKCLKCDLKFFSSAALGEHMLTHQVKSQSTSGQDNLQSTSGMVQAQGTSETVKAQGTSGTVKAQGTSGTVKAQCISGTVKAQGTSGTVKAQGTSGTVKAQCTSGTVKAQGTSGTVSVCEMRCSVCDIRFTSPPELWAHHEIHNHSTTADIYQCLKCTVKFANPGALCSHVCLCHGEIPRSNHLDSDKSGTAQRGPKVTDLEAGKESTSVTFLCEFCTGRFGDIRSLLVHLADHHAQKKQKNFFCLDCGVEFLSAKAIDTHACKSVQTLPGYGAFRAALHHGNSSVPTKENQMSNKPIVQESPKNFPCLICNRTFNSAQDLGSHMNIHAKKPFSPQPKFPVTSAILAGNKSNTEQVNFPIHACKLCDKVFESGQSLGGHMRGHNADQLQPTKEQSLCTQLPLVTPRLAPLTHHSPSTESRDTLQCKICHKIFMNELTLALHMTTHRSNASAGQKRRSLGNTTNEPLAKRHIGHDVGYKMGAQTYGHLYECTVCARKFSSRNRLQYHMQTFPHGRKTSRLNRANSMAGQIENNVHFKCPKCPEKFSEHGQLQQHIGRCSAIVDSYFECPLCKLCFFSQAELMKHSESHSQ